MGGASGGSVWRPAAPGTGSKRTRIDRLSTGVQRHHLHVQLAGASAVFIGYALLPRRLAAVPRLPDQLLDFQEQSRIRNQLHKIEAHRANRQREAGAGLASNLDHFQVLVHHHSGWAVLRQEYAINLFPHVRPVQQLRGRDGAAVCRRVPARTVGARVEQVRLPRRFPLGIDSVLAVHHRKQVA